MKFTKTQGGFFDVWREDPKVIRVSKFTFFGTFVVLLLYSFIALPHFGQKIYDTCHTLGIRFRGEGVVYFPLLIGYLFYLIVAVYAISFVIVFFYSLIHSLSHIGDKVEKK